MIWFFFLMIRRPPRSTRTDTLFPYTTLVRSTGGFPHLRNRYAHPSLLQEIGCATDALVRRRAGTNAGHSASDPHLCAQPLRADLQPIPPWLRRTDFSSQPA